MRVQKTTWSLTLMLCIACAAALAQDVEFVPEVDAHVTINHALRAYFQAKEDRDGGDPTQSSIGPSIEVYLKPLVRLKKVTLFDLDDAKSRAVVAEAGYRYVGAPNAAPEQQMLTVVTFHYPLQAQFLLSDRNRAELDWKSGDFTWRYRNRVTLERSFPVHSYHLIPYVAVEPYYVSEYKKWSTTDLYAGCLLPVGKHVEFNPYFEHENNTGKSKNSQQNFVGLMLYLFFSVERK